MVALRIATVMIEALRYKLRCFGIPIVGPKTVLCDNKSVVTNSSVPVSVLNKKHNDICYHRVSRLSSKFISFSRYTFLFIPQQIRTKIKLISKDKTTIDLANDGSKTISTLRRKVNVTNTVQHDG